MPIRRTHILPHYSITVPVITSSSTLPSGTQGVPYSDQLLVSGGIPTYHWVVISDTGSGLALDPVLGILSGSPNAGNWTLLIQVTDHLGTASAPTNFTLSVQTGTTGAFIPDAGYSYIGPVAWDSPGFTITKSGGGMGSVGPIQAMADDFRAGTVGNTVPVNQPGIYGSSTWGQFSGHNMPTYQAAGNGNCVRLRNNGDSDITFACLFLQFAATTGIRIFFAENSHGIDYNTQTSSGGNNWNYKIHWLLQNQNTGGAFNEWITAVRLNTPSGTAQAFGSNNSMPGPLPTWDVGDGSEYDPNDWTSVKVIYRGDPNNPTTATGLMSIGTFTHKNNGLHGGSNTTFVLFSSTTGPNGDYASANGLTCPGIIQGITTTAIIDRADYNIQVGPNCCNGFWIGNASTWAACTSINPCTIDTTTQGVAATGWTDSTVSMTPRRGVRGFPATLQNSGLHLYREDVNGNVTHVGVFGTPIVFDRFISTTGSDSNNGLTPATAWAITSLISTSANHSAMAGKKIGLVAGTYNIAGTTGVAGATHVVNGSVNFANNPGGCGSYCAMSLPAGVSAAQPTYIASCDTSGNYSARAATIFVSAGEIAGTNKWGNAIMGTDAGDFNYVTIDGIVFNGNNMDCVGADGNEGAHIIMTQGTGGSFSQAGTQQGFTVQNCEIFGIAATDNGGNDAGVFLSGCNGVVVKGNYFHDINKQQSDASHCHASESYGCTNVQWLNNTVTNCSGGAFEPKEGNSNCIAAYNYIYNTATSGVGNSAVMQAWDGAQGNPNTPNTGFQIHHNILDGCGRATFGESNNANHSMQVQWFNNTVYDTRSSVGGSVVLNAIDGAVMMHYNNLYVFSVATSVSGYASFTSGSVSPCAYDAAYGPHVGSYTGIFTNGLGGDPVLTATDPQFTVGTANIVSGANPRQYQLAGGSAMVNAGHVGGTSGGSATNIGAWDGVVTLIGCGFGPLA